MLVVDGLEDSDMQILYEFKLPPSYPLMPSILLSPFSYKAGSEAVFVLAFDT